jgi:uncharacterized protein YecE (DUF72 family)
MVFSVITSGVTATAPSLDSLHVGTSGWSYASWKPGFYPPDAKPTEFLRFYAERFETVELNTTGYRLPAEEQFRRWADATPPAFRFAPKLQAYRLDQIGTFVERVRALGGRLGPIRAVVQSARDDGLLAFVSGSLDPSLRIAWDFRHPSWRDAQIPPENVRVNELESEAAFRYLRLREPPYDDVALETIAAQIGPLLEQRIDVYCYFRHEDEPTAPRYAAKLRELVPRFVSSM